MQKLVALCIVFAAACGGNDNNKIKFVDSNIDGDGLACDVLHQTGCAANEKCTWIIDQATPTRLGHIGCAPQGDKAVGAACTRNAPGPMGWDDCMGAAYCRGPSAGGAGFCHGLCDPAGADPMCASDHACVEYQATFQSGTMYVAGMCDQKCNPLTDNNFLGSAAPPGSPCMANEGCYGAASTKVPGTAFTCGGIINTDLHHRDVCAANTGNSGRGCGSVNGCAPGYIPMYYQTTGSMTVVCIAMCEPATCYSGNCGAGNQNKIGANNTPSHRCRNQDVQGTINTDTDGDQCLFNWRFEIDTMAQTFLRSDWSDKVGWCIDHSQYKYDSNGNGMLDGSDGPYPACDTFTTAGFGTGSAVGGVCDAANGCVGGGNFGCVDSITAGLPAFQGTNPAINKVLVGIPRAPYTDSRSQ